MTDLRTTSPKRKMRTYFAWARKDGKQYRTTVITYSSAAATRVALQMYPESQGYTNHFGSLRNA